MSRKSGVAFAVQSVERDGKPLGYVVSGFLDSDQLSALRGLVDSKEYERSKRWRGKYQGMAKAIVDAIDNALA